MCTAGDDGNHLLREELAAGGDLRNGRGRADCAFSLRSRPVRAFSSVSAALSHGLVLSGLRLLAGHSSTAARQSGSGVGVESSDGAAAAFRGLWISIARAV